MQSYEVYPTKEIEEKGSKITKKTNKTPEGKLTENGEIVFENGDSIRHVLKQLPFYNYPQVLDRPQVFCPKFCHL